MCEILATRSCHHADPGTLRMSRCVRLSTLAAVSALRNRAHTCATVYLRMVCGHSAFNRPFTRTMTTRRPRWCVMPQTWSNACCTHRQLTHRSPPISAPCVTSGEPVCRLQIRVAAKVAGVDLKVVSGTDAAAVEAAKASTFGTVRRLRMWVTLVRDCHRAHNTLRAHAPVATAARVGHPSRPAFTQRRHFAVLGRPALRLVPAWPKVHRPGQGVPGAAHACPTAAPPRRPRVRSPACDKPPLHTVTSSTSRWLALHGRPSGWSSAKVT